jgi:hypothetical protein
MAFPPPLTCIFILNELSFFGFLLAIPAEAAEFRLMVCNYKAGSLGYPLIKLLVNRFIQIEHPAAPFTPKMIVALSLCLEPAQATIKTYLRN